MIYIDIETKPLPREEIIKHAPAFSAPSNWKDEDKIAAKIREKEDEFIERAALNPACSTVQAIGIYNVNNGKYHALVDDQLGGEKGLLAAAWEHISSHDAYTESVLGWNILGFDLPFMIKRSWKNAITIPSTTIETYKGRSYLNPAFKDMMKYWMVGTDERFSKLNSVLKFFEIEEKVDLGDELFYQTYARDPELALKYLERDIMGMVEINQRIKLK